ncbi:hypothetical protein CR513_39657, partial [Mucuna pruriens]
MRIVFAMDFGGSKKKLEPKRSQVKVDPIQHLWKVASKFVKGERTPLWIHPLPFQNVDLETTCGYEREY